MKKLYDKIFSLAFFKKLLELPVLSKVLTYEFIIYVFFGVFTTVVNFVVSAVCNRIFGFGDIASFEIFGKTINFGWVYVTNTIAWVIAVLFAYLTNKIWVFENRNWNAGVVIKEIVSFFSARFLAFLLFDILVFGIIEKISLDFGMTDSGAYWAGKISGSVLTIIFNYIVSKFVIFKEKNK